MRSCWLRGGLWGRFAFGEFFLGWICFAGCLGTEGLEGHSRLFFFVMAVLTNGVFVAGM